MASKRNFRVSCAVGWRFSWATTVRRDASGNAGSKTSSGESKLRTFCRAIESRVTIRGPSGTEELWADVIRSAIGNIIEYSCTSRVWSASMTNGLSILLYISRTSFQINSSRSSKFTVDFQRWGTSLSSCNEDSPCSRCTSSKQTCAGCDLLTYSIDRSCKFSIHFTFRHASWC